MYTHTHTHTRQQQKKFENVNAAKLLAYLKKRERERRGSWNRYRTTSQRQFLAKSIWRSSTWMNEFSTRNRKKRRETTNSTKHHHSNNRRPSSFITSTSRVRTNQHGYEWIPRQTGEPLEASSQRRAKTNTHAQQRPPSDFGHHCHTHQFSQRLTTPYSLTPSRPKFKITNIKLGICSKWTRKITTI